MAIESATTATKTGQTSASARQFGAVFTRVIAVRVAFEEDSIAAGLASAAVYTVNGAEQGDFVLVAAISDLGDDITFTGQVTDANQVTVVAQDARRGALLGTRLTFQPLHTRTTIGVGYEVFWGDHSLVHTLDFKVEVPF